MKEAATQGSWLVEVFQQDCLPGSMIVFIISNQYGIAKYCLLKSD
jgi:hypothetical protein